MANLSARDNFMLNVLPESINIILLKLTRCARNAIGHLHLEDQLAIKNWIGIYVEETVR